MSNSRHSIADPSWTRWSGYAIVGLIAAAAADVTGRLAVVGPVRLTVYQGLAAVVLVLCAVALKQGRIEWPSSSLHLPAAAFAATLVLSLVFTRDMGLSLTALASMLSSIALAYMVLCLVDGPDKIPAVVWGVVLVAAILGAAAVLEYLGIVAMSPAVILGGAVRSRVTFKDPNILGSFLSCATLLGVAFVPDLESVWRRALACGGLSLTLAGVATTQSRGAMLGLALGVAVLIAVARVSLKRKLTLGGGILLVGAVLVVALAGNATFRARVLDVGKDESAMTRVWMAESAVRAWVDHPFGVGVGDFGVVYRAYADPRVRVTLTESHTMYTTLLLELGFLGLAAAVFLAVRWFRATIGALASSETLTSALARGALAAGVALGVQAFTYSLETSKYLWLVIGLGFAAAKLAERSSSHTGASGG